jgi:Flp pilus assembly protein TadG
MRDLMRGVRGAAFPVRRPATRAERGVIGVLVAVLIGGGVLFGMAALVVDVGQLYQERAELQDGADAAAIAVAKSCALGSCTPGVAAQYANANASKLTGNRAAVEFVCGSGSLGNCPVTTGATACPSTPSNGTSYVTVRTSTLLPGGSTLLPPVFARTLFGMGTYQGSTVYACAQAAWFAPAAANTVAFTISACEWDQATSDGTRFAQPPPYPPNSLPSSSMDRVLKLHTTAGTGCSTEPAGADGPGNFGWTDDPTGTCELYISGGTFGGNTGVSASNACKTALSAAQANRTLIFIAVYTSVSGTGAATYTLKGFAAFVVTGYHLSGFTASDWLKAENDCKGSDFCINGYFTQGLIPSTGAIGDTPLGAVIIKLTG